MDEAFHKVVQQVFTNWSALKLAVDHSMGGPNSKQTAIECINYMTQFGLYEAKSEEDIQEALEDILDQEFDTICEDNSPKEVAQVLFRFVQLLRDGNQTQCELDYANLPTMQQDWLSVTNRRPQQQNIPIEDDSSDSSDNKDAPMEEDSEWTQVKSRRRR